MSTPVNPAGMATGCPAGRALGCSSAAVSCARGLHHRTTQVNTMSVAKKAPVRARVRFMAIPPTMCWHGAMACIYNMVWVAMQSAVVDQFRSTSGLACALSAQARTLALRNQHGAQRCLGREIAAHAVDAGAGRGG